MAQEIYLHSEEQYSAVLRHASTLIKILTDLNSENAFTSDSEAFIDFILAELADYNSHLIEDGVNNDIIFKATYLVSSAFDDVFARKNLYGQSTKRGFLLHTHNEPGALSRFWEIADEFRDGVDIGTVDLAILTMSLIELGYQGKYENHPDRFAIIRVQNDTLTAVVEEFMLQQEQLYTKTVKRYQRSPIPFWPILSFSLLIALGLFYATELMITKKFNYIETAITKLEKSRK